MSSLDFVPEVMAGKLTEQVRVANGELEGFLATAPRLDESPDPQVFAHMASRLHEFGTMFERAATAIENAAAQQVPGNQYAIELLRYGRNLEALQAALTDCTARLCSRREELRAQLARADAAASFGSAFRQTF